MNCPYCNLIKTSNFPLLFEDDQVVAFLTPVPHIAGHILVMPKEHIPILEKISDDLAKHLFNITNKISSALFESFNAQGTNILIQNGQGAGQEVPHFSINIFPRRDNDGYSFEWDAKEINEKELESLKKEITQNLDKNQQNNEKINSPAPTNPIIQKEIDEEKEEDKNYLIKQLKRTP
ncbi:HIT family protein [Candidatus Woesearchaeota archaeon]|jgi:histidine triad (HIT) family protein|nr:HIT family protein [Candidatus Woesearchaeota archaeon]